jgi:hypothetical protein
MAMMKYVNGSTAEVLGGPEFWVLADRCREAGRGLSYSRGAFRAEDGTWWCPDGMTPAELAERQAAHERDVWWEGHKRDTSVIVGLGDEDLKLFRLLADIRADIPVIGAATQELWRRGIRDYPVAI